MSKKDIHVRYIIGILIFLVIYFATLKFIETPHLKEFISFGATLSAFVLAIIAIFHQMVSKSNVRDSLKKISRSAEEIETVSDELTSVANQIDSKIKDVSKRTQRIEENLEKNLSDSSAKTTVPESDEGYISYDDGTNLTTSNSLKITTAELDVNSLLWIHWFITEKSKIPEEQRGTFRKSQVFIGDPENPRLTPPPPEEINEKIDQYLDWWRTDYERLESATFDEQVEGLAKFHHEFLQIHPFIDSNGKIARKLLKKAGNEFFGSGTNLIFSKSDEYLNSLEKADKGNLSELEKLIKIALDT